MIYNVCDQWVSGGGWWFSHSSVRHVSSFNAQLNRKSNVNKRQRWKVLYFHLHPHLVHGWGWPDKELCRTPPQAPLEPHHDAWCCSADGPLISCQLKAIHLYPQCTTLICSLGFLWAPLGVKVDEEKRRLWEIWKSFIHCFLCQNQTVNKSYQLQDVRLGQVPSPGVESSFTAGSVPVYCSINYYFNVM